MITRTGMNEGVTLCFTHAFSREIQDVYRDKGLGAAMDVVFRKGFQGDLGTDQATCKAIVEKVVEAEIPRGNGRWWFKL